MTTGYCESPTAEDVARRAYEIWEERGCPPGDGTEDWERAVAELKSGRRSHNGADGGLRVWWGRVRRKIIGRDG